MHPEASTHHINNKKGTRAEMSPAINSGIVTGDVLVSYWPIFQSFRLSRVTVPDHLNSL